MTALVDLYAATRIEFPSLGGNPAMLAPRPLGETGEWPFEGHSEVWIVTAENPRSAALPLDENVDRMRQLDDQLRSRRLGVIACYGVGEPEIADGRPWVEESRLLLGASRNVVFDLARMFEQSAVFRWAPEGREVVGVLDSMGHAHGWALVRGEAHVPRT